MPTTAKDRNKRWLPVLIACAVLIGVSMWVSVLLPTEPANVRETPATTVTDYPQRLGEYDGKLARFSQNGTLPLEVYDVDITTLPAEERTRLADGIPVPDADALAELLDNYTS